MRPAIRLAALALLVCLFGAGRAEAGIWDWLEELNGPGPSTGNGAPIMVNLFCSGATPRDTFPTTNAFGKVLNKGLRINTTSAKEPSTCLYLENHVFQSPEKDVRFHEVDLNLFEVGASTRIHPTLEIGGALGRLGFSSEDPDRGELQGSRMTVTFPRVSFKPLLVVPRWQDKAFLGFIQIYFKHTVIVGELRDTDFASKPATEPFERRNQRVESLGLVIDLTSILYAFER